MKLCLICQYQENDTFPRCCLRMYRRALSEFFTEDYLFGLSVREYEKAKPVQQNIFTKLDEDSAKLIRHTMF